MSGGPLASVTAAGARVISGVAGGVAAGLARVPGVGGWDDDPAWATVYDWMVEHPRVGVPLWRLGANTDLRLLYRSAAEIGTLPAGSRVLDIPSGGGVALRGLRAGQGLDYVAADIAPTMLERTMDAARARGVADQVRARVADVGALPFADATFDLVVTFTGLHCFPDPHRAVVEMARVLRPGGAITGSALLADSGPLLAPLRHGGRLSGLLGPMCTAEEITTWFAEQGLVDVRLRRSGALGYFRAERPR